VGSVLNELGLDRQAALELIMATAVRREAMSADALGGGSGAVGEEHFEKVRYFIKRNDPSDVYVAAYRLRRTRGRWQGYFWDWRAGGWRELEDIVRQYWNGFDADVDEVTEAEALEAIRRRV
jgi:hypothetical protein